LIHAIDAATTSVLKDRALKKPAHRQVFSSLSASGRQCARAIFERGVGNLFHGNSVAGKAQFAKFKICNQTGTTGADSTE
jgi:hypothetical protein